jgi:signal peptidase I
MSRDPLLSPDPSSTVQPAKITPLLAEVEAPVRPPVEEAAARAFPLAEAEVVRAAPRRLFSPFVSVVIRSTLALVVLYGLLFNFSVVRGSSMSPSIFDGDRILIDHFSYLFSDVRRGDIIVLQYPLDPKLDYIKRVVGLPGDEILIDRGQVFVNGEKLEEDYVDVPDLRGRVHTRVEEDHFFVLGDNRCHSSDSREFGQVPVENLLGKVDLRVWPLGRIGLID